MADETPNPTDDGDDAPEAEETPPTPAESAAESPAESAEGGNMAAILAGAAILIIAALVIFWPQDDGGNGKAGDAARSDRSGQPGISRAGGAAGGVGAREVDAAKGAADGGATRPRVNPALQLPKSSGLAPGTPPQEEKPPAFESTAEEIAWYEKKLAQAERMLESRATFKTRLDKAKERAQQSPNPEEALKAFERRKNTVEANFAKAETKVEELKAKLAELRGEG